MLVAWYFYTLHHSIIYILILYHPFVTAILLIPLLFYIFFGLRTLCALWFLAFCSQLVQMYQFRKMTELDNPTDLPAQSPIDKLRPYKCAHCGRKFAAKSLYNTHLKSRHADLKARRTPRIYYCSWKDCGYLSITKVRCTIHQAQDHPPSSGPLTLPVLLPIRTPRRREPRPPLVRTKEGTGCDSQYKVETQSSTGMSSATIINPFNTALNTDTNGMNLKEVVSAQLFTPPPTTRRARQKQNTNSLLFTSPWALARDTYLMRRSYDFELLQKPKFRLPL